MTDLIERLRLGDGTSPDHLLLLEAADALEKSVECMCGICKLGHQRKPLTDEEIWKFWCSRPEVPEGEDDSMEAVFVAAVRRVLAAHNIKENT